MPVIRRSRLRTALSAIGAIFLIIAVFKINWTPTSATVVPLTAFEVPLVQRQKDFWKAFKPILEAHGPNCPSPTHNEDASGIHFNATTNEMRPDMTFLDENNVQRMQDAHALFLQAIVDTKLLHPVHAAGTRGIVSSAGGQYFPVFVATLRMLRRTGSTLPVEVFMKDASEYEKSICEDVLPKMNARCLILSDVLGKEFIEHFQLKVFAVLLSSFEELIWMDADCFPLHEPEILLDSDIFKSTGMITWPDFWQSSASPLYFKISNQPETPMNGRQTTEAGVILMNKKTHLRTLLLAAYYNYYGPSHYFRLLSQGGPGEGDKETFLQAAYAVNEPFYAVSERVQAIGHPAADGMSGSAMVQSDPIQDHALFSQGLLRVLDPSVAKPPQIFFIHANYPKFNPGGNFWGGDFETAPTIRPDGTDGRAWIFPEDVIRRFGFDAEKVYWEELKFISCSPGIKFQTWRSPEEICQRVEQYWANVFAEPHEDDPAFSE
ncbi:mannosyltransferase putative-domain-containing protein [Aspergillus pseudoustus]|uniref:Mannosyltransferase putative-domain-containing protein n=1 Tax=Aspergillus pseudoustus TaxID=1810923 RepID=A0ABR4KGQ7_9EURO